MVEVLKWADEYLYLKDRLYGEWDSTENIAYAEIFRYPIKKESRESVLEQVEYQGFKGARFIEVEIREKEAD